MAGPTTRQEQVLVSAARQALTAFDTVAASFCCWVAPAGTGPICLTTLPSQSYSVSEKLPSPSTPLRAGGYVVLTVRPAMSKVFEVVLPSASFTVISRPRASRVNSSLVRGVAEESAA